MFYLQELVAVIPSQQNLKGIGISVLVISFVLGLVSLSVFLMTPPYSGPRVTGVRISLQNFTSDLFTANTFNATWLSGVTSVKYEAGRQCVCVRLLREKGGPVKSVGNLRKSKCTGAACLRSSQWVCPHWFDVDT